MKKGFGKRIIFLGVILVFSVVNVQASCELTGIASTSNGYVQGSTDCNLMMYCIGYKKKQVWDTKECKVYKINAEALPAIQALGGASTDSNVLGAKLAAFRGWSEGTRLNNGTAVKYDRLNTLGKEYYNNVKNLDKSYTLEPVAGSSFDYKLINYSSSNGRYTANITVSAGSGVNVRGQLSLGISSGHTIVSSSCNGPTCNAMISGPMEECEGANPTIYVYSSNSNDGGNTPGTPGTPGIPGDDGENESEDFYFFDCYGKQNYIGYTTDVITKNKLRDGNDGTDGTPGDDGDRTPGDRENLIDKGTIYIPDQECDCSANISEKFKCDGSGREDKFLYETENVTACITSGRYHDYCGSSIKKMTDIGKSITTIAGNSTSEINLAESNKYCSVYCVENIDYSLPGRIDVKNGRYFTLENGVNSNSVEIKGKRRCYTDKIDTKKYAEDMINKQTNIINAYNEYLKKKAIFEGMNDESNITKSTETVCTGYQICSGIGRNRSCTTVPSVEIDVYSANISYKKISCDFNENTGEADCSPDNVTENIVVKESYSGSGTACASYTRNNDVVSRWNDKKDDYESYEEDLNTAIGSSDSLKDIIKNYKSCYNWTNNYCFDPKVEFSYEDGNIYTEVNNQELQADGNVTKGTADIEYYKNVNSKYEGVSISINEQNTNYVYVKNANDYLSNANIDFNINYVKSEIEASKKFSKGSIKVCTYHPYGTILTGNNCGEDTTVLGNDGYVFPVSLEKKENRLYNYDLKFSNIGVSGNDATCDAAQTNRLMGCSTPNDVYTITTSKTGAKYTCQYGSCPKCDVECVCPDDNPGCYVEDNICKYIVCNECTVKCVGCLWNSGDAAFSYKQVSLSDVFPNSENHEDVGYNWNTDASVNPQAEKAKATINKIEQEAEEAYKKPEYSYVLNPTTLGKIRAYNKAANAENQSLEKWGSNIEIPNGGYSNDTLTCKNGEKCTSSFLDGLGSIVGTNNYTRSDKWKVFDETTNSWKEVR